LDYVESSFHNALGKEQNVSPRWHNQSWYDTTRTPEMMKFGYIIIIAVLACFVWSMLSIRVAVVDVSPASGSTPTPSPRTDVQLSESKNVPQIPSTLTVGGITYDGVRYQGHDAAFLRITHNDGAARIELSQLPEEIRKELNYDATAATAALRDERQKRIAAASAASEATARAPVTPIPGTLRMLIAKGNENVARTEFQKYLRTAPRVEARGTVLRHLDSGHLLATGSIGDPKTRAISYQTFLLFGLPEADRLADGDTFDPSSTVVKNGALIGNDL
jgi:hypothetical protein